METAEVRKPQVTVIPAKPREELLGSTRRRKLRVAAYCRVSSEKDEQLNSYEVQTSYYTEKIQNNPDWQMVRVFADRGISGTSLRERDDFKRMLRACREGKIDLILVKSVSRFGRNIVDVLRTIRSLQERGIGVIFEKEAIDTRKMNSELMLAFHSAFSQSESESIRENVSRGQFMSHQLGVFHISPHTYGFAKDEAGEIILDEEQAEVIRTIARWFLDGMSFREICAELDRRHIPSPGGKDHWRTETIKNFLTDVKYKGDYLYGKTYKPTLFAKHAVKNNGAVPQVLIRDCLPRVFEPELFDHIQTELTKRSAKRPISDSAKSPTGRYSGKYALSGVLVCGHCGAYYRRVTLRCRGKSTIVWKCGTHQDRAADCPQSPRLEEITLRAAVMRAIREEYIDAHETTDAALSAIRQVIDPGDHENEFAIRTRMAELQSEKQELIARCMEAENEDQYDFQFARIMEETKTLRAKLEGIEAAAKERVISDSRMEEISDILKTLKDEEPEYDDVLVRKAITLIRVLSADQLEITFRDGRTVATEL